MSKHNSLSKHRFLSFVLGYDDLKNPTKEVIIKKIAKKKHACLFPLIYRLILSIIICGFVYQTGMDWYLYASIILFIISIFVNLKHN